MLNDTIAVDHCSHIITSQHAQTNAHLATCSVGIQCREKQKTCARVSTQSGKFDRCSHAYTSHQQTIFWWNLNSVKYEKFYRTVVYCAYIIHALPKAALNKKINSFVSDSLIWMAYKNYAVVLIKKKIKKKNFKKIAFIWAKNEKSRLI